MSLAGTLEKLYARRRFGIRPGIDRVGFLLERLGHPEQAFRAIHVVGTNGKGSTSAFLSSILNAAGYRTALFTSPHLVNFTERFRINGRDITSERLTPLLDSVLTQAPDEATFFEIVTALAALCFAEERVDIAVMEAGMGGRSDASAAIPGIMTVISPISLDHSDYLGATLTEIAAEKAAIAEPGTPMVTAAQTQEVHEVIRKRAASGGNTCFAAERDFASFWSGNGILDYRGIHATLSGITPGIPGRYQAGNAALALAAAEIAGTVGLPVPQDALTSGISAAHWPGRMELIDGSPPILLDGAHNPAGVAALAGALADYRYQRLFLVTGIMADKDAAEMFALLANRVHRAYAVTPAVERALDDTVLTGLLTRLGITAETCGNVANGIESAQRDAVAGDLILVCGSLFTVGEAKAWLKKTPFEGIRG
jgi:dihydrofolate synthase/folylpolyglutamate synthase